jgi:hypothetical protein
MDLDGDPANYVYVHVHAHAHDTESQLQYGLLLSALLVSLYTHPQAWSRSHRVTVRDATRQFKTFLLSITIWLWSPSVSVRPSHEPVALVRLDKHAHLPPPARPPRRPGTHSPQRIHLVSPTRRQRRCWLWPSHPGTQHTRAVHYRIARERVRPRLSAADKRKLASGKLQKLLPPFKGSMSDARGDRDGKATA